MVNTLSVGAAAATVGIIIGVLTVTGTPFNIAAMVNAFALDFGTLLSAIDPTGLLTVQSATLFMTLVLVAASCIVMGAGLLNHSFLSRFGYDGDPSIGRTRC